jgi:hypothetical protein
VAGTISAAAVILLTIATKGPAAAHAFTAWRGLIQRAALIPCMCWLFVFALRLRKRRAKREVEAVSGCTSGSVIG